MSYLPEGMGSRLTRAQKRALENEFSEMQFVQLMALATHAAGSYATRHVALEYMHNMRTLEDMAQSLPPHMQDQMRRLQEHYTHFSLETLDETYVDLLDRFNYVVTNPTERRNRQSKFRRGAGELITGFTWGLVDGRKLLK